MEELQLDSAAENGVNDASPYAAGENATGEHLDLTRAFAKRLKEKTSLLEAEYSEKLGDYKKLEEALKSLGYEGESPEELSQALSFGKALGEDNGQGYGAGAEVVERARKNIAEGILKEDMAAIKAYYPDCPYDDVRSIGSVYLSIMQSGAADALTAYEAQMAYNARATKNPAPMGAAGKSDPEDRDYFTVEEARKLTGEDYDRDPTLLARVRKSMTKWK